MIKQQISVFLENKPGRLLECVSLLAKNNIDMQALCIADTNDYGILRVIVDRPEEAFALFRQNNWLCKLSDVLAVTVPDQPGSLAGILSVFAENSISLAYSYAFFAREKGQACIILRVDDNLAAEKLLKDAGVIL